MKKQRNRFYSIILALVMFCLIWSSATENIDFVWADEEISSRQLVEKSEEEAKALRLLEEEAKTLVTKEDIEEKINSGAAYSVLNKEEQEKLSKLYGLKKEVLTDCEAHGIQLQDTIQIGKLIQNAGITADQYKTLLSNYATAEEAEKQVKIFGNFTYSLPGSDITKNQECKDLLISGTSVSKILQGFVISKLVQEDKITEFAHLQTQEINGLLDEEQLAVFNDFMDAFGTSMDEGIAALAETEDVPIHDVSQYPNAPFRYNRNENERINITTGAVGYDLPTISIPGSNGLNLNINVSYDLSSSSMGEKVAKFYARGTSNKEANFNKAVSRTPLNDFAAGWSFNFSHIVFSPEYFIENPSGVDGSNKMNPVFVRSDGRSASIARGSLNDIYTDELAFEIGEDCRDIKIYKDTSCTVGNLISAYRAEYADGSGEYFDHRGLLLKTYNRYNDEITYEYQTTGTEISNTADDYYIGGGELYNKVIITDTNDRVIVIERSGFDENNMRTIVITLPDNTTVQYNIKQVLNHFVPFENNTNSLERYYLNLDSVTNQAGETTHFEYLQNSCCRVYKSGYVFENFYPLTKVVYPTGAATEYTYEKGNGILGGLEYDYFRITSRKDVIDGNDVNLITYDHNNSYATAVEAGQTYSIEEVNAEGVTTIHRFLNVGSGANEKTEEETYSFNDKNEVVPISKIRYEDYAFHSYPTDVITYRYDGRSEISTRVRKKYDSYRNLIYAWDAQQEGTVPNSPPYSAEQLEHAAQYTYDQTYQMLTEKKYKRDANTTIKEVYELDEAGSNVIEKKVYENENLVSRETYLYRKNASMPTYTYSYVTEDTYIEKYTPYVNNTLPDSVKIGNSWTKYSYDNMGRLIRQTDPNGNITAFEYDGLGRQTKIINPDDTYTTNQYIVNAANNKIIATNENNSSTEYAYDKLGKIKQIKELSTNTVLGQFEYDVMERLSAYIDGNENRENYQYDKQGRIVEKEILNPDAVSEYKAVWEYDDVYNSQKGLSQIKQTVIGNSSGNNTITTEYYNKHGFLEQSGRIVDGTGIERLDEYQYDYLGNNTQVLSAMDKSNGKAYTQKFTLNYAGQQLTATDVLGNTVSKVYDLQGRVVKTTDAKNGETRYTYDEQGQLLTERVKIGGQDKITGFTYDPNGNKIKEYISNDVGQENSKREIAYAYDCRNQLKTVKSQKEDGAYVYSEYVYDAVGNLTDMYLGSTGAGVKDGNHTIYTYDTLGRMTSATDPMGQTEYYTSYDAKGNLLAKTDKNGKTIRTEYTALDQPALITVDGSAEKIEYTYNPKGLPAEVEVTDANNSVYTTNYSYDRVGRLTNESDSDGTFKSYSYNLADARTYYSVTYNGSTVIRQNYEYDDLNRLQKVYKGDKTSENLIAVYEYDNNSNLTKAVNGNGTQRVYEYGDASNPNLLTKVMNKGQGETVQNSYSYQYYLDGNVAAFTEETAGAGTRTVNYVYTKQGQLKSETDSQYADKIYTYDNYGNRSSMTEEGITTTYSYNANNQLVSESRTEAEKTAVTEYAYDPNGNMKGKMGGVYAAASGEEAYTIGQLGGNNSAEAKEYQACVYEYDSFNRLTKAVNDDMVSTYTYNADGMRRSKTVNGMTTNHIWDGSNIVAETDGNKQVTAKYYRGSGLISQEVSNTESYYQFNMHGDVIGLTGANGELIEDYDYDAFGNQINQSTEKSTPFRYAGEYYDEETDLIYLRNRYYSPTVGQFITEDPAKDGTNWYVYCRNNPIMHVDPWGLDSWAIIDRSTYGWENAVAQMKKYYGTEVHVVYVDTAEEFVDAWNNMGMIDGEKVEIDGVFISVHGDPTGYAVQGIDGVDFDELNQKNMDMLVSFGCNTGFVDEENNVAVQMLKKNNIAKGVIASDGTVWGNSGFRNDGKGVYAESIGDDDFKNLLNSYGVSSRENEGFLFYYEGIDNKIEKYGLGKKINNLDKLMEKSTEIKVDVEIKKMEFRNWKPLFEQKLPPFIFTNTIS